MSKNEIMVTRGLPMYPSTLKRWIDYKERLNLTHDEMLNFLMDKVSIEEETKLKKKEQK